MGGECPTSRESPSHVSCSFEALAKQKKNASAQGSLKFREVSNYGAFDGQKIDA